MTSYYNENDQNCCELIKNLIQEGQIPNGIVDCRSIKEVEATDLRGFTQCHFFCGIAGWSYALKLAGWPDDRPVWTGSAPCQPYSAAGKQKGDADERNLWPEMYRLIRECRPDVVMGEQVSSAIRHGWLDGVSADLEGSGYAVGAIVLGAHSVKAPHQRQRLFWVGHRLDGPDGRLAKSSGSEFGRGTESGRKYRRALHVADCGANDHAVLPLADVAGVRRAQHVDDSGKRPEGCEGNSADGTSTGCMAKPKNSDRRGESGCGKEKVRRTVSQVGGCGSTDVVANGNSERFSRREESHGIEERGEVSASRRTDAGRCRKPDGLEYAEGDGRIERGPEPVRGSVASGRGNSTLGDSEHRGCGGREQTGPRAEATLPSGPWSDFRIVHCTDGKARRVGAGVQCLVDGIPQSLAPLVPVLQGMGHSPKDVKRLRRAASQLLAGARRNRVCELKGNGNAIVPELAAVAIRAFMDVAGK